MKIPTKLERLFLDRITKQLQLTNFIIITKTNDYVYSLTKNKYIFFIYLIFVILTLVWYGIHFINHAQVILAQ